MRKTRLGREEYKDKVLGCWLGKNIGGTLGAPYEGKKYVHNLTFYDPVPKEPLPNDDLDFQLVWLRMLEDRGPKVMFSDFAEYWMKYLSGHWYNEYSFCTYNLQRGLRPPISGALPKLLCRRDGFTHQERDLGMHFSSRSRVSCKHGLDGYILRAS